MTRVLPRRPLSACLSLLAITAALAAAALPLHSAAQAAAPAAPASAAPAPLPPNATMDQQIAAIRDEGLNRSHVMQTLDYLCNVIGPRLTGSPELKHANDWTRDQFTAMGMANAHEESWGPFGKGWSLKRFSLEVTGPVAFPVRAYPKAWSPGLAKPVETEAVFMDVQTEADLASYEGKLKDKIVLIGNPRAIAPAFQPLAKRLGDDELAKSETLPSGTPLQVTVVTPDTRGRGGRGARGGAATASAPASAAAPASGPAAATGTPPPRPPVLAGPGVAQRALAMANSQGAAMILDASGPSIGGVMGDGGIIFVAQATVPAPAGGRGGAQGGPPWALTAPNFVPEATVCDEDYDRIVRMIRQGQAVKMAATMEVQFQTADPMAYNTIAEIPGTDPALKDQIVMAGAHMDSWHGGTGATDNGAGCGTVIEAMRILTALHLQPRRTIRAALWSGEEQNLLGSAAYVGQHFATLPAAGGGRGGRGAGGGAPIRGPEFDQLSVYFNLDNGTGKIRGIYGQGNDAGGVLFKKWFAPFADLGADTVTLGTNGQTDHMSFDAVGLPGFEFIQDGIDYLSRTHHSTADVYERLQPDDMKINATIMAAFLWQAANMDQRFPRKPVAAARGAAGGRGNPAGQTQPASSRSGAGRRRQSAVRPLAFPLRREPAKEAEP